MPNSAFLVVPVCIVVRGVADEELRHVVEPQLMEVVRAHEYEHVGAGLGQCLPECLDLPHPFVGERGPFVGRCGAGPIVERVVSRGNDGSHRGHV